MRSQNPRFTVLSQMLLDAPSQPKNSTVEAYLAAEIESETRSEYRNGEIIPMTGGTPTHNELVRALTVIMSLELKGKPYRVFVTDQRLWIRDRNLYTYPDVMVIANPLQLQAGRKDTVTNPVFIAEVLSDSTQGYDRGDKFAAYRTLPTFQEYLLIAQNVPHVEQYTKQEENQWLLTEYNNLDDKIMLSSLGIEIAIAELYENIEFS